MSATPEMIEAASRALCVAEGIDPDAMTWITVEPGVMEPHSPRWMRIQDEVAPAVNAALAAMWRPISEAQERKWLVVKNSDSVFVASGRKYPDGEWCVWTTPGGIDTVVNSWLKSPTHFIPLSVFEGAQ